MNKTFYFLISAFIIVACSSIDKTIPISYIEILNEGKHYPNRPEMAEICKGFLMSAEKVEMFYHNAALTHEKDPGDKYKVLPCFSSGTAYLYGEKYHWVIRAGGVGEFYSDNDRFVKICGIKCCDKVRGIC
ncbi:hypothetical protein [Aliikangiella coralliicola]|uniref:Uncharacterized protein n=1 Tax=Aliikangiella coralliicola TaxID=2592383 RepID=A0A545U8R8_9GAMM|nr:hypothetical protein [Aliikangiella coralliicola]TQV85862.1 hypothetical protein FLL46_18225 [Aliikangiella coralliicola]